MRDGRWIWCVHVKLDPNDYYPPPGPFTILDGAWHESGKQDAEIEGKLRSLAREAWDAGDWYEQTTILYFIFHSRDDENAGFIIDGLQSDDRRVVGVAATLAVVLRGKFAFDFGPDFRRIFRSVVRRFPENDTGRPRDFYGHDPGDDDDHAHRPFVNLYEDWMADDFPRDPLQQQQLADAYREAWAKGDAVDRAFVLHFVSMNAGIRERSDAVDGMDLVIEGMESDDPRLAHTAAFVAQCLIEKGARPVPHWREILEAHNERFPSLSGFARYMLNDLDNAETKGYIL